jgi:hypothetical protein
MGGNGSFERARQGGLAGQSPDREESNDPMAQLKLRLALERRVVARKAERAAQSAAPAIPGAGGTALDGGVRRRMEAHLGADLTSARVHTGAESAAAAKAFGARAFTVGNDVHFNSGEFQPGSKEGDRLLAHELVHVVQGQSSPTVSRKAETPAETEGVHTADGAAGADGAGGAEGQQASEAAGQEVSQPGDAAEQEADAVADQATEQMHAGPEAGAADHAGRAGAGGATDATAGAGTGPAATEGSAQAAGATAAPPKIAAKLEGVGRKIYRLAGSTQGVTVQAGLPGAGGNYQTALDAQAAEGGFKRDSNLNNEDKVALEGELSGSIMRHMQSGEGAGAVHKVSKQILRYIEERERRMMATVTESLEQMVGKPPYFGRMGDKPTEESGVYAATLQNFLKSGEGPISQHIGAHQSFLTNIYEKDVTQEGKKLAETKGAEILDALNAKRQEEMPEAQLGGVNDLKKKDNQVALAGTTGGPDGGPILHQTFNDRGRDKVGAQDAAPVNQPKGIAPADSKQQVNVGEQNVQSHQRGTDVWKTNENNLFIQHARLVLDMPLSGGSISGSTAEMLQCARIMGLSDPMELTQYGLGCFAQLGSAGAHSFHEVMSVVTLAGGSYTPGDYSSALTMVSPADKERLLADPRFSEYLGGSVPRPTAPGGGGGSGGGGSS